MRPSGFAMNLLQNGKITLSDFLTLYYDLNSGDLRSDFRNGVFEESKDAFMMKIAVPGLEKKDVNIKVIGDILQIQSEGSEYTGIIDLKYNLPKIANKDKVKAKLEQGVLTIIIEKKEDFVKNIEIE